MEEADSEGEEDKYWELESDGDVWQHTQSFNNSQSLHHIVQAPVVLLEHFFLHAGIKDQQLF